MLGKKHITLILIVSILVLSVSIYTVFDSLKRRDAAPSNNDVFNTHIRHYPNNEFRGLPFPSYSVGPLKVLSISQLNPNQIQLETLSNESSRQSVKSFFISRPVNIAFVGLVEPNEISQFLSTGDLVDVSFAYYHDVWSISVTELCEIVPAYNTINNKTHNCLASLSSVDNNKFSHEKLHRILYGNDSVIDDQNLWLHDISILE